MEVVSDEVVEFFVHKFKSKAGKDCSVNKMTLKTFGPVSLGFTKPNTLPFIEGDHVVINVDKDYGEWAYKGEAPGAAPTVTAPPAPTPKKSWGGGGGTPKVFPVPPTHGDMAIIHQNSLTNAREHVDAMLGIGHSEYETMTKDQVEDEVIRLAYRFADFSSGADLSEK